MSALYVVFRARFRDENRVHSQGMWDMLNGIVRGPRDEKTANDACDELNSNSAISFIYEVRKVSKKECLEFRRKPK